MSHRIARKVAPLAAVVLAGCAEPILPRTPEPPPIVLSPGTADATAPAYSSPRYRDAAAWLCLPGRDDPCAANLDATDLLRDGSRVVVRDTRSPAVDKVDCFYVYPTVDLSLAAANHQRFDDREPMTRAVLAQAARFRSVCRLFAPLYRQVTIGTYMRRPETRDAYLAVAASDVIDAFAHYMATWNGGRKIVLIGHSQGAEMVQRVLKRFFDDDAAMRARLLLAMPIGGHVEVATGKTTGGSFTNIPYCTRPGETGCVVAYRSATAGTDPDPDYDLPLEGRETVCVNPADLDAPAHTPFTRTFIPSAGPMKSLLEGIDGVTTPFVLYRKLYDGVCTAGRSATRYLAVRAPADPSDPRTIPFDLHGRWMTTKLGLHALDLQFAQGDLIDLVARRAGALP